MGSKADRRIIERLDKAGVTHYVDLDGGWGEEILESHLDYFKNAAPIAFRSLAAWNGSDGRSWAMRSPEWAAKRLHVQKERGAQGLKIWKPLGLHVEDRRR